MDNQLDKIWFKIKPLRECHNLTQQQLGKKVGVSRTTVNKWENGIATGISLAHAYKLSEVLGVSLDDLKAKAIQDLVKKNAMALNSPMSPESFSKEILIMRSMEASRFSKTATNLSYYEDIMELPIFKTWLTFKGISVEFLRVARVTDNAMAPLFSHGDLIVVDLYNKWVTATPSFYLLEIGNLITVRKLAFQPNSETEVNITSNSENKVTYPDYSIPIDEIQTAGIIIHGRISWSVKTL